MGFHFLIEINQQEHEQPNKQAFLPLPAHRKLFLGREKLIKEKLGATPLKTIDSIGKETLNKFMMEEI